MTLKVDLLEERTTPTVANTIFVTVQIPESSFLVQFSPPSQEAAVQEARANLASAEVDVRTDLFCGGVESASEKLEFWDEWFGEEKTSVIEFAAPQPVSESAADAAEPMAVDSELLVTFASEVAGEGE